MILKFRKNGTWTQLQGGLGNQLFQYSASCVVAKSVDKLHFETHYLTKSGTYRELGIFDFNLPGEFISQRYRTPSYLKLIVRIINKLMRTYPLFSRFMRKITRKFHVLELGYVEELENQPTNIVLNGYFQSYRYPEMQTIVDFKNLELKTPSENFLAFKEKMLSENPVVLHVRRGDYADLKELFGMLGINYYKKALDELTNGLHTRHVWIFSDSVETVKSEFGEFPRNHTTWVGGDSNLTPAETLMLMSCAKDIAIANSTFSWWAAYIGGAKRVVAPYKWFRNMDDPKDLIPDNWIRKESDWLL